ncbi:unnamed protein product [Lactuca saligna]|uniref:Thioredoxin domain-containing protein n=1 Tax=Lactuca saligna TaxID=75948 RepID=A0AA35ZMM8_LACSI|nr:unnamed protein product [Lactuca saligna]
MLDFCELIPRLFCFRNRQVPLLLLLLHVSLFRLGLASPMSLFEATRTPKRNNRRIPSCSSITWRLNYFIIILAPVYFYTSNVHCPNMKRLLGFSMEPVMFHPGIILMTRVDCANKINTNLCDKFSISHYPSLFWGPPSKFVGGNWNGKDEKSKIVSIEDGRTSDRLLKWINTQLGRLQP